MPLGDPPYHGPSRRPGARPIRLRHLDRRPRSGTAAPAGRAPAAANAPAPQAPSAWSFTLFMRYILPAAVVLAGVVAMAFGTDISLEGGAGLVSAGLAIWFVNWLFRLGVAGDAERDAEDRAREYFDRHGRWPEGR